VKKRSWRKSFKFIEHFPPLPFYDGLRVRFVTPENHRITIRNFFCVSLWPFCTPSRPELFGFKGIKPLQSIKSYFNKYEKTAFLNYFKAKKSVKYPFTKSCLNCAAKTLDRRNSKIELAKWDTPIFGFGHTSMWKINRNNFAKKKSLLEFTNVNLVLNHIHYDCRLV